MPFWLMQMDKNNMKVEQTVSMHSHGLKRLCKRQIVTDPKSRNASHIQTSADQWGHCYSWFNDNNDFQYVICQVDIFRSSWPFSSATTSRKKKAKRVYVNAEKETALFLNGGLFEAPWFNELSNPTLNEIIIKSFQTENNIKCKFRVCDMKVFFKNLWLWW